MNGSKEECAAQLYRGIKRFFRSQSKALNFRELHLVNIDGQCTQVITSILSAHKSVMYKGKGTIWVAKDGENPFGISSSGENAFASASAGSASVPLARGDNADATHISAGQQKAALTAPFGAASKGASVRPQIMPIPMLRPDTVEELLALPPSNHTLDVLDNACDGCNHRGVNQIGTNKVLTQGTCNQILCNDRRVVQYILVSPYS